jgi:hypothetical protein
MTKSRLLHNRKKMVIKKPESVEHSPIKVDHRQNTKLKNKKTVKEEYVDDDDDETIIDHENDDIYGRDNLNYEDDEDEIAETYADPNANSLSSFIKRAIIIFIFIFAAIMLYPIVEPFAMAILPSKLKYPAAILSMTFALIASFFTM